MTRTINILTLAITGSLATLLFGNFLVHLAFYLYDGNVEKFLSPTWMVMNGIGVLLTVVFLGVVRREGRNYNSNGIKN